MFITSMATAESSGQVQQLGRVRRHWLVNEEICGVRVGSVSLDVMCPGTEQTLEIGAGESASVAVAGAAGTVGQVWHTVDGLPPRVRSGDCEASLLTLHSRAGYTNRVGTTRAFDLDDVPDQPAHNPALGFHHMRARMLVEGASEGRRTFTLGLGTFAAGQGCHALHRHANAAEIFYVWEGAGAHLTGDGAEHPVGAGDLVFVPPGEWHGFRNTGSATARAFFGYLGVDLRSAAGYEVMHPVDG